MPIVAALGGVGRGDGGELRRAVDALGDAAERRAGAADELGARRRRRRRRRGAATSVAPRRARRARPDPAGTSARRPCTSRRSRAISSSPASASQRSISTALVPRSAGVRIAWIDARDVRQRRRHQRAVARRERVHALAGCAPRRSACCACAARPSGSAVVPDVYMSISSASASTARRAIGGLRRALPRRVEQRVERDASAAAPRRAPPAPRAAPAARRAATATSARIVAAAELAGDHQHRRARTGAG